MSEDVAASAEVAAEANSYNITTWGQNFIVVNPRIKQLSFSSVAQQIK